MLLGFFVMQQYKRTHINELSRFHSHFLILCLTRSGKHTYTRVYLSTHTHTLSLAPSLLLIPVQDQSPALSL